VHALLLNRGGGFVEEVHLAVSENQEGLVNLRRHPLEGGGMEMVFEGYGCRHLAIGHMLNCTCDCSDDLNGGKGKVENGPFWGDVRFVPLSLPTLCIVIVTYSSKFPGQLWFSRALWVNSHYLSSLFNLRTFNVF
jgi:hypothetical protein